MSHPFEHPKGREFLKQVAQLFSSTNTYVANDSSIAFVCGGPMDDDHVRPKFCEYAKTELPQLRIFLAENAQRDFVTHRDPGQLNVAEFEDLIAHISTCIILFPESPGSSKTTRGFPWSACWPRPSSSP